MVAGCISLTKLPSFRENIRTSTCSTKFTSDRHCARFVFQLFTFLNKADVTFLVLVRLLFLGTCWKIPLILLEMVVGGKAGVLGEGEI